MLAWTPLISRLGTGADTGFGALLLLAVRPVALLHVGLSHVDPDRVMRDPVHDGVRMEPTAEPRVPVLLLELSAEDGRRRAVPQLNQLPAHQPRAAESGIVVSERRVLRIMQKLGLAGKGATRKHRIQNTGGILDWCFLLDGSKACKTHIQRTGGLQVRLESARLVVQEKLAQSITAVLQKVSSRYPNRPSHHRNQGLQQCRRWDR